MSQHLRHRMPDLVGALLAIGLGVWCWWLSSSYSMGELRAMGPGYFPRMVSLGLICLGVLLLALTLLRRPGASDAASGGLPSLGSVLLIAAALLSFALLIQRMGMFPAIFAAVLLSTFASDNRNILRSVSLAGVTAGLCVVLFVYALGLPIKVFEL